jgi:hypothetical protein
MCEGSDGNDIDRSSRLVHPVVLFEEISRVLRNSLFGSFTRSCEAIPRWNDDKDIQSTGNLVEGCRPGANLASGVGVILIRDCENKYPCTEVLSQSLDCRANLRRQQSLRDKVTMCQDAGRAHPRAGNELIPRQLSAQISEDRDSRDTRAVPLVVRGAEGGRLTDRADEAWREKRVVVDACI